MTEAERKRRLALDAAGGRLGGLFPGVVLVAGAERQKLYRHPLPTEARLGPHALLAITAQHDGLYVSLTLGDVIGAAQQAYARAGFPEEGRRHHQGGLTGYRGREVFGVPGEPTRIPAVAAVAWNPSIAGGAKSEDTALVSGDGIEVLTRTPDLPELDLDPVARPAIVEL